MGLTNLGSTPVTVYGDLGRIFLPSPQWEGQGKTAPRHAILIEKMATR